jgi:hypothetical protein
MSTRRYLEWCERQRSDKEVQAQVMFDALRRGVRPSAAHINNAEYRKARIKNGKCFLDANESFERYCIANANNVGVLEAELLLPILQELGIEISAEQMEMLIGDLIRQRKHDENGDLADIDGIPVISEAEFRLIFQTCYDNQTSEPSEHIKAKLQQIMARSKNPFIQMLSNEEQRLLIDGRGAGAELSNISMRRV